MTRRARLALLLYGVGAAAYALDRTTKILAEQHLAGRPPVELIPNVLQLAYTTNSGGAFGILGGQPVLFFVASILVCVAILVASTRLASMTSAIALGLVIGGAVGNLTDRLIRGPGVSGRVIDFIDFHVWPVFNLADSAIVIGAVVLISFSMKDRDKRSERPSDRDVVPG